MNNYEYIIASLPVLVPDWKFSDRKPESHIQEIREQCSEKDCRLIDFLLRGFDSDNLTPEFYKEALSHANGFIREYFSFDLNVRNTKVRFLNKALGRKSDRDTIDIPCGDFEEETKLNGILQGKDILMRERDIDNLMWDKIDNLSVFHYFDINLILAFISKLKIVSRWYELDEATGREMFRKLVNEVRGTFKGVEYDG